MPIGLLSKIDIVKQSIEEIMRPMSISNSSDREENAVDGVIDLDLEQSTSSKKRKIDTMIDQEWVCIKHIVLNMKEKNVLLGGLELNDLM